MRKTTLSVLSTAFITVGVFLFTAACHKNKSQEDMGYAMDHALTEQSYSDVENIADAATAPNNNGTVAYRGTGGAGAPCATVTHSGNTTTIDFGTTNCVCKDGRSRRGKIIITVTGVMTDIGSVRTITFDNFYQNDNKVTGTKTVTNMGPNAAGQPYFNISVNGTVSRAKGGTISASWTRVRTWTQGYTTDDRSDDVFQVTGTGTINRDGTKGKSGTIQVVIPEATPLVMAAACHWIEAGTVNFTLPNGLTRSLNFGTTPNCDDQAVLTLPNGNVHQITLP